MTGTWIRESSRLTRVSRNYKSNWRYKILKKVLFSQSKPIKIPITTTGSVKAKPIYRSWSKIKKPISSQESSGIKDKIWLFPKPKSTFSLYKELFLKEFLYV